MRGETLWLARSQSSRHAHECGSGISTTRLLFVSTTTARSNFASIATENCWFSENFAELGKPKIARVCGVVHVTGAPTAGGHIYSSKVIVLLAEFTVTRVLVW